MAFHGSYDPSDVTFLLKLIELAPTEPAERERLIQSGERHYSEMIGPEMSPKAEYLNLFWLAMEMNGSKLAAYVASLVRTLAQRSGDEIVIVSLARAGTPIGVLLRRGLEHVGRKAVHYSVSIIRDRGIDWAALDYITGLHKDTSIVFVDGWTGKGVISRELARSIGEYNLSRGTQIDSSLVVVADLAGAAALAATDEDFLIPSALLNSTVSGLISRTIRPHDQDPREFHACVWYEAQAGKDLSRYYVDCLTAMLLDELNFRTATCQWSDGKREVLQQQSKEFVRAFCQTHGMQSSYNIKPGIGESTRALLRRMPTCLVVRDADDLSVAHLISLAGERKVPVLVDDSMPYRACVVISKADRAE